MFIIYFLCFLLFFFRSTGGRALMILSLFIIYLLYVYFFCYFFFVEQVGGHLSECSLHTLTPKHNCPSVRCTRCTRCWLHTLTPTHHSATSLRNDRWEDSCRSWRVQQSALSRANSWIVSGWNMAIPVSFFFFFSPQLHVFNCLIMWCIYAFWFNCSFSVFNCEWVKLRDRRYAIYVCVRICVCMCMVLDMYVCVRVCVCRCMVLDMYVCERVCVCTCMVLDMVKRDLF
jgi:hypothetical protein